MVPPVADQGLLREDADLLCVDQVSERDARALVRDGALLRLALREGEGQAAVGLGALAVERHGDAASVLLAGQPRDEDGSDTGVPTRGDHRAWRVNHNHDLLAKRGVLPDQNDVRLVELQRASVVALARLLRRDHHDDDVGGPRVARAIQARAPGEARNAVADVDFGHLVAREAVPSAASCLLERVRGARLRADESHVRGLRQWQHAALVLEEHRGLGDDAVGEGELARGLVVVSALMLAKCHRLATDHDLPRQPLSRGVNLRGLAERVAVVGATQPILRLGPAGLRLGRRRRLGRDRRRVTDAPRAFASDATVLKNDRVLVVLAARPADVLPTRRPPAAEALGLQAAARERQTVEAAALDQEAPADAGLLLLRALRHAACEGVARRHLQVQARLCREVVLDDGAGCATAGADGLVRARSGAPIAHHLALEAHFRFQVLVEDVVIRARVGPPCVTNSRSAMNQVVRAHDRRYAAVDCRLEGRVVHLEQCPLIDNLGHATAVLLDGVWDPMLDDLHGRMWDLASCGQMSLDHLGTQERIFAAHVFPQTSVPSIPCHVDARPELATVRLAELRGQLGAPAGHELDVPGRGRIQGARPAGRKALVPLVELPRIAPSAIATVVLRAGTRASGLL
mmetsp:Transcript_81193/g.263156  ORF Transcript_81193/g.263156 Transcript_81193/m.263156 type:complete len:630 (-) Transcript_81193:172-2061(-)